MKLVRLDHIGKFKKNATNIDCHWDLTTSQLRVLPFNIVEYVVQYENTVGNLVSSLVVETSKLKTSH